MGVRLVVFLLFVFFLIPIKYLKHTLLFILIPRNERKRGFVGDFERHGGCEMSM